MEKQTYHAGFEMLEAKGWLNFVRAALRVKGMTVVPRTYEIEVEEGLVKTVIYPDAQRAEFTYQGAHPCAASIRGRDFVFESAGDVYKEDRTTWYDLQVIQEDSPVYSAGTVVLSRFDMLEVIAPLMCYQVSFMPDYRIQSIVYPDRSIGQFIYQDDVLCAFKRSEGESVKCWQLAQAEEAPEFFEGRVQRLQVVSDPKSKHFGSLLLEGSDGDAEIRAVLIINGSSIVIRYEQGVCRHVETTGADGQITCYSAVAPGLAVCDRTGQIIPMPDYSYLFHQ